MPVKRMDNMGIVVDDLDATVDFFLELGLELEGRATIEGEWAGRVTGLGDQHVEVAMMRTPDGHSRLELSRFVRPRVAADHRNAPVNARLSSRHVRRRRHRRHAGAAARARRRTRRRACRLQGRVPPLLHPRTRRTSHRARTGAWVNSAKWDRDTPKVAAMRFSLR